MTTRVLLTGTCLSLTCMVASGHADDQRLTVAQGLKLWLRADAGVTTNASGQVSLWKDQSGNGHDVSQSNDSLQPVWVSSAIQGKPALRFADDMLHNSKSSILASGSARTVIIVGDVDDQKGRGGCLFTFRRCTPGGITTAYMISFANVGANNLYVYTDGVEGANNARIPDAAFSRVLKPFVASFGSAGAGKPLSVFLNGVNQGAVHEGGSVNQETGPDGFTVGDRDDLFGAAWPGDIAEILVYDSFLPETDRKQVEKYLGEKYNIPVPSP
ncbi:MAG: hypothetical protein HY646_20315 [Acidobacteria bacterium]|nr:hypothetical protein [Acidobacteriota bacterium]